MKVERYSNIVQIHKKYDLYNLIDRTVLCFMHSQATNGSYAAITKSHRKAYLSTVNCNNISYRLVVCISLICCLCFMLYFLVFRYCLLLRGDCLELSWWFAWNCMQPKNIAAALNLSIRRTMLR